MNVETNLCPVLRDDGQSSLEHCISALIRSAWPTRERAFAMSREALMGSARSMQRFYAAAYLLSINAGETPLARVEVCRAAFRITHFPGMDDLFR